MGQVGAQDIKDVPMLLQQVKNAGDTQLLNIYAQLELIYSEVNADSAIVYGDKAIALSRKLKQPFYEAQLLVLTGYDYISKGDFSIALDRLLKASKMSDQKDIAKNILPADFIQKFIADYPEAIRLRILKGYVLNNLGVLYAQTGNRKLNKEALLEAKALVEQDRKDYFLLGGIYNNLSFVYLDENDLDSAIYFQKLNLIIDDSSTIKLYQGSSYTVLADFYTYAGQMDSAWPYYYKGIDIIKRNNVNKVALGQTYLSMSALHAQQERLDSASWYAKEGTSILKSTGNTNMMPYVYSALSDMYSYVGKNDSAYHYLTLANSINDSLQQVQMDNLHRFYNDVFEDQVRLKEKENITANQRNKIILFSVVAGFIVMAFIAFVLSRLNKKVKQANQLLQTTLADLNSTQAQLIQSEKMASLGELTAGIAHEIQNPLNFVNNFSDVSNELMDEMQDELEKGDVEEAKTISNDIKQNLSKISHHGRRAEAIVKGMLQHSRAGTGKKELTDLNALAEEYLRLAYHGMQAKDKNFSATYKFEPDPNLPKVEVVPQDIGRVLLNLINNAFYAVTEKSIQGIYGYEPTVILKTQKSPSGGLAVIISDNGPGIPNSIKGKIFQPFFTTKPTGQGTGLGLSLSYDIVKAHGGELKVESKEGEGSIFIIQLPIN